MFNKGNYKLLLELFKQKFQDDHAKRQKELSLAYIRTFQSADGQKVLKHLMESFSVFDSTVAETAEETYFNEGARSVVLRIFKTINQDPSRLTKLVKDDGQSQE